MDIQLRELISFLHDRNPQVRQLALEHLLPQTPPGSPHRSIFFAGLQGGGLEKPKENDIVKDLKLLCRDEPAIAHDAFRALVNLSDSPLLLSSLSEPEFLTFLISYIINPQSLLADLASMLLSNLSASSNACATLLVAKVSIIITPTLPYPFHATQSRCATSPAPESSPTQVIQEVLALPLLLDAFAQALDLVESNDLSNRKRKGDLHFLASVFANISVAPAGRDFFLSPRPTNSLVPTSCLEYPIAKILSFTEHKDIIRRRGVASTIKNCAFLAAAHKALLSPDIPAITVPPSNIPAPGLDALQYILLPLAGPEEFDLDVQERLPPSLQLLPPDKIREPDPTIRLTHVETLLLLCHTRWGRDFLRGRGVYEIVRATHESEKVDKISEHIERLVQLLKGDEPNDPRELEEHEVIVPGTGESETRPVVKETKKDEDEDDVIQEV